MFEVVCLVAAVMLTASALSASASPAVAQAIAVSGPITDELGQALKGTDGAAAAFGIPVVEGDIVQVLNTTDGVIYPPAIDGTPDSRNPLIMTTRIGHGVSPNMAQPAMFGSTVSPRPGGNSKIFVRVFNASSQAEASFYGDSQLFTVKSWKNEIFVANIAATDKALDASDDDGDGLNNSLEQSYGSDPASADTDGDGSTDAEEVVAGTDLLDAESLLLMARIQPAGGMDLRLVWDAASGHDYRVEVTTDLCGSPTFEAVGTVTATGATCEFIVQGALANACGTYRVCAIQ